MFGEPTARSNQFVSCANDRTFTGIAAAFENDGVSTADPSFTYAQVAVCGVGDILTDLNCLNFAETRTCTALALTGSEVIWLPFHELRRELELRDESSVMTRIAEVGKILKTLSLRVDFFRGAKYTGRTVAADCP